jgi:transposase
VKLMPPKYVKAYVKRGKTDAGDAAAICEAVTRPSMSFVPVKGLEQQGLSMLHSARSQLIGQRTQLINGVRGHLSELGIMAERGLLGLAELAAIVRDESDRRLPATARAALMIHKDESDASHEGKGCREPRADPDRGSAPVSGAWRICGGHGCPG